MSYFKDNANELHCNSHKNVVIVQSQSLTTVLPECDCTIYAGP